MLVPPDHAGGVSAQKLAFHVNKFCSERVMYRRSTISKSVREVVKVIQDILKEVEVQEPRFISSLNEVAAGGTGSYFEGLHVHSPTDFEVILYLNQMGVFNFVDDGSIPGAAVLKLSDGRKRSMSLWVEFITASGYLSARKIRSRFQTLVAQVSAITYSFLLSHSFECCSKERSDRGKIQFYNIQESQLYLS